MKVYIQKVKRKPYHGLPMRIIDVLDGREHKIGYSTETFPDRDDAYKITVHGKSYRDENGKPRKKQCHVATMTFYELIKVNISSKVTLDKLWKIERNFNEQTGNLFNLIYVAINEYIAKNNLKFQFSRTQEGKAFFQQERTINDWKSACIAFIGTYPKATEADYRICYDIFGNVADAGYLQWIQTGGGTRPEPEHEGRDKSSNYYSYLFTIPVVYDDNEKVILKKFYKILAMKCHPDHGGNHSEMLLLNKLKEEWKI